jgi:chemotaxis protein histidine kinase CheA
MNPHGSTLNKFIPLSLERLEMGDATLDDVDKELFPFFEEEARAEIKAIEESLHAWDKSPTTLKELGRQFHTLKGAANSIGHLRIGALAGGMKDLLEHLDPKHTDELRPQIIKTNILVIGAIRALLQEARAPEYNPVKKEQVAAAVQSILLLKAMEEKLQGPHEQ